MGLPEATVVKIVVTPLQIVEGAGCVLIIMGGRNETLSNRLVVLASRYRPRISNVARSTKILCNCASVAAVPVALLVVFQKPSALFRVTEKVVQAGAAAG